MPICRIVPRLDRRDQSPGSASISEAELALLLHIRGLPFGRVVVKVQNGIPTFIEKHIEDIKLS